MQASAKRPSTSTATAPVIITGMHRSGTSLVASFLAALGVDLGPELVPADDHNPRGYYEDQEFLELSRRMLERATLDGDGGHRDWGWTESEHFDLAGRKLGGAARALVEKRRLEGGAWGWKDPRSTLLLELWDGLLGGDARFVFLYRYPWDVADSMQRLGAEVFLDNPGYAYRMWSFYNRRLLDFYRANRRRAVLASVNAVVHEPERFVALLRDKLALELGSASLDDLYEGDRRFLTTDGADPLIDLVAAVYPHTVELLRQLDEAADLASAHRWQASDPRTRIPEPAADDEVDLSIVIPCYDHGEYLIEAVASVERTAPESCELVIVNDGSRQRQTLEVLEVLRRADYRVIDQENRGLAAARNRGFEATRGRYLFPLDADNRVRPGYLAAAIELLDDRREIGVVFGDRWQFGLKNGRLEVPELDFERLLWRNTLDACAVFRRSLWQDVGGYDTALQAWEDWELWIHAAARDWRFHHLGTLAFDYRVRPGSLATLLEDRLILETTVGHVVSKHREIYRQRLHERFGVVEAWPGWLERQRDHEWLQKCALEQQVARQEGERQALAAACERSDLQLIEVTADRDRLQDENGRLEKDNAGLWLRKCELEDENGRLRREKCELETVVGDLQAQLAPSSSEPAARSGGAAGWVARIAALLKSGT